MGSVMAAFAFAPAAIITLGTSTKPNQSDQSFKQSKGTSLSPGSRSSSGETPPGAAESTRTKESSSIFGLEPLLSPDSAVLVKTSSSVHNETRRFAGRQNRVNSVNGISTYYEKNKKSEKVLKIRQSASFSASRLPLSQSKSIHVSPVLQRKKRKKQKNKLVHQSSEGKPPFQNNK